IVRSAETALENRRMESALRRVRRAPRDTTTPTSNTAPATASMSTGHPLSCSARQTRAYPADARVNFDSVGLATVTTARLFPAHARKEEISSLARARVVNAQARL